MTVILREVDPAMTARPLILWGTDAPTGLLVGKFTAFAKERINNPDLLKVFKPENIGEFARDLSHEAASLRQSARAGNIFAEPGFVLICSAFSSDAEMGLDVLQKVSDIAREILPGDQSIILVVLLPPQTADEQTKVNTCRTFLKLEKLIGAIPFLSIAFVNQLTNDLEQSGTTDVNVGETIFELLFRQLIDHDLENIISRFGRRPFSSQYRMKGQKCFCSTSGFCRLIYHLEECIEYLEAKFQYELFHRGLKPGTDLSKRERKSIQEQSDRFVDDLTGEISQCLTEPGTILAVELKYPTEENTLQAQLSEITSSIQKTISLNEKKVEKEVSFLKDRIERNFLDFLPKSPRFLLSGELYLNILTKKGIFLPFQQKDDTLPCGIHLKHLKLESIQSFEICQSAGELTAGFEDKLKALDTGILSNDKEQKKLTEESYEIERRYNFLQRFLTRRGKYKTDKKRLEQKQKELKENHNASVESLEDLRKSLTRFIQFMDDVVLPHVLLVKVNQIFAEEVEKSIGVFCRYVSEIKKASEARWARARDKISLILEASNPTAETVLSRETLEIMYQRILDGRSFPDLVHDLFRFVPSENVAEVSYKSCSDLKDHYQSGFGPLLDRMKHFSHEEVKPALNWNILDIIEMGAGETPYQYLENKLNTSRQFLDFAPGHVSVVQQRGFMNEILAVKTDETIQRRLTSDYKHLFGENIHFIENKDISVIDITCLIFGFPIFAIHSLTDCQDRFQQVEEKVSAQ